MRTLLLCTLLALPAVAENEDVVRDTRAVYAAVKSKDVESARQKLLARADLDWPSVRKGLMEGRWYRAPLSTNYGIRHSGKHMKMRLRGDDGKERGFTLWVPKAYDGKARIPVLFYLHHNSFVPEPNHGAGLSVQFVNRFKKAAEEQGVLVVAPYTSRGAEWWLPEGKRLVEWTLETVKEHYNIDEDRIALMGSQDGAGGVWYLGQEMPGTWSCLMPMSGNHYSITSMVRPLYLGTLDRMDVMIGVTGKLKGRLGEVAAHQYLHALKPMIDKAMRVTTVIAPRSSGDFRYMPRVREDVLNWVKTKKRKAMAEEVDVESDGALRSLWLELGGVDMDVPAAHNFPTTRLVWTPGEKKAPTPKIGLHLGKIPNSDIGLRIDNATGAALKERIVPRDILLEVNGNPIREMKDVRKALEGFEFGKEVRLLLVREVKESEVKRMRKFEAFYLKRAAERSQLRAEGKPVPPGFMDYAMEDDGGDDEEEEEGCSTIELGDDDDDDDGGGGDGASEKTVMVAFERVVQLRRPEEDNIVRDDFGAQWDRSFHGKGVKVRGVVPGTLADRSGLRDGDVIVAAGSDPVHGPADLREYFEPFKFEKAPQGERFVEFTVLKGGKAGEEGTVRVEWTPVQAARVDVRYVKKDAEMHVLVRHVSKFTVYLDEDLVPPGQPFHIYINGIPYLDLVEGKTPDYPHVTPGSDSHQVEQRRVMMRKRAKHPGWQPDIAWAVENALKWRDRSLVVGGKLEFDLSAMKAGFEANKKRRTGRSGKRADRIRKAYEEYKSKG